MLNKDIHRKIFRLLLGFFLIAATFVVININSATAAETPGGCNIEPGSGYGWYTDMTFIQQQCNANCAPVVIAGVTYNTCVTSIQSGVPWTVYGPRNGLACGNNCLCREITKACNDRCMEKDKCPTGQTCMKVADPNEWRCRAVACSGASDCNCATPTPTPALTCQTNGSGSTWCPNHGGVALTVDYDVSNWNQCLTWCNQNMTAAQPVCQYNADGPRNCWVNYPPAGGINNCTWTNGVPPYGACYSGIPPINTPSPTPTPVPCTVPPMTLNTACNIATASYTADSTHVSVGDTITIKEDPSSLSYTLTPATNFGNNIGVRTATYPFGLTTTGRDPNKALVSHPLSWTHSWRNVVNGNSSVLCSNTVSYNTDQFNIPRCEAPSVVTQNGLNNPVSTSTSTFNVNVYDAPQESGTGGFVYQYTSDPTIPNDAFLSCTRNPATYAPVTFAPGQTGLYNCTVNSVGTSSGWVHAYSRYVMECPNLVTPGTCTTSFSNAIEVKRPPGLLLTNNGDVFVRGTIDEPGFPTPGAVSFSSKTLSSAQVVGTHKLATLGICAASPTVCSTNRYLLLGYEDANTATNPNWYSILTGIISQDKTRTRKNYTASPSYTYNQTDALNFQILNYDGNLIINADSKCQNKNIIVVNGDLTINPQFTINDHGQNACLFVIKGTVNVNGGSAATTDLIEAFMIASNINIPINNQDGLRLKGGLITTDSTKPNIFQRNVNGNTPAQVYPLKDSEMLDYEGARYIYFFGDLFKNPNLLGVREPSYN